MRNKIKSFTGLRFIMIMTIVIVHFDFLKNVELVNEYFPKYWSFQTLGVNYFFLLSGFGMMLGSIRRENVDEMKFPHLKYCLNFGIKHVRQIYPLYIATIIIGLLACIILEYNNHTIFEILWHNIIKLILSFLLLQAVPGMSTFWSYNGVTWFLSCLFCIYLVSPWLIYFLRKYSRTYIVDIMFIFLDLIFIVGLAYLFEKIEFVAEQMNMTPKMDVLVYSSPYRRVFYVLTGMSLAMIYSRLKNTKYELTCKTASILEFAIIIIAIVYYMFKQSLPRGMYHYVIDIIICACFIIIFAFDKGIISTFLAKQTIQKLGNISMYIFLIHYPIVVWGSKIIELFFHWNLFSASIFILCVITITYFFSILVYKRNLKIYKPSVK